MTFPYVEDFNTSDSASTTTSHNVDLPATVNTGELLVVFFGSPVNFVLSTSFPVGWTEIYDGGVGFGAAHISVAYKIADGTEGGTTITVVSSSSVPSSHVSFTISNHNSSTNAPEISTGTSGSSSSPNPDSLTASWGTDDNLFIAIESNVTQTTTAYPTNFDDNQHTRNYTFSNIGVCTRDWNTNATQDPGIFTLSSSSQWLAATMVVQGGTEGVSSSSSSRSSSISSSSSRSSSSSSSSSCLYGTTIEWESHYTGGVGGDWYQSGISGIWDAGNSEWDSEPLGTFGNEDIIIDQSTGGSAKAWTVNYRPDVLRVTSSDTTSEYIVTLYSAGSEIIGNDNNYTSGDIISLTFPMTNGDIEQFFIVKVGGPSYSVTNIEFGEYVCIDQTSSSSISSSSSSSSSATPGTVVWGHHTSVDETYDLDFTGNTTGWTIGGTPGNDNEYIDATSCDQIITFDPHYLGTMTAVIKVDKYMTGYGPAPVIQYRTAATKATLLVTAWSTYNGVSFTSLGWIQIRFIHV